MKLFGTDGIRFVVGQGKGDEKNNSTLMYSPYFVVKVALASSRVLGVGKYSLVWDTRFSSPHISYIFASAFSSLSGAETLLCGVLPTPASSALTKVWGLSGGFSVSASHNPPEFNGIKFFSGDGFKLSEDMEMKIEQEFSRLEENGWQEGEKAIKEELKLGAIQDFSEEAKSTYKSFLVSGLPKFFLRGVKILIDCSNGATYKVAPEVFEEMGADVKVIGNNPDGKNINVGVGSENPETAMGYDGFDFKIIFDGDGDRVLIADSKKLYDGDQLISLLARFMLKEGKLKWGIVGTILSNMALERFAKENGINFIRVDVGDRNIAYKMREVGANLGGEESGHIILSDLLPTGDGILVALRVLKYVIDSGKEIGELVIDKFYQAKGKVKIKERIPLDSPVFSGVEKLKKDISDLGGRAVVRYSGTEPVIRVMVEHEDRDTAEKFRAMFEEELRKIFG